MVLAAYLHQEEKAVWPVWPTGDVGLQAVKTSGRFLARLLDILAGHEETETKGSKISERSGRRRRREPKDGRRTKPRRSLNSKDDSGVDQDGDADGDGVETAAAIVLRGVGAVTTV